MNTRILRLAAVILIVALGGGVRLYAADRLDIDYDEPVYLSAGVEYARAMRLGDFKMLAWSEHTYEHPALYKILYGVALLTQPELDRLPENDLPRLAPIASTEAGRWNITARHLSVIWGTLAVLALSVVNPLAGLFLAVSTLSVKYTSEVYLEALPLFTGLLSALAYLRWSVRLRDDPESKRSQVIWLILSAVFLGMTAASKYVHAVVGLPILFHCLLAIARNQIPRRNLPIIAGWGVLSLVMFFVFDPYLWPHPIFRLTRSILFHEHFLGSRLVEMYHYPFWQPLRWLSAFSSYYDLHPTSAFLVNIDTLIFVAALIGLPRLYRHEPFFFYWLLIGLGFLLVWTTKWPQYTLVVLVPFCVAAAQGMLTVWDLAIAHRARRIGAAQLK